VVQIKREVEECLIPQWIKLLGLGMINGWPIAHHVLDGSGAVLSRWAQTEAQ
jgi:hypothetical protein